MLNNNKLISISLFIYITSLLLFDNRELLIYVYISNLLFIFTFLIVKYYNQNIAFKYNSILIIFLLFAIFSLFSTIWAINIEYALYKSITLILILINSIFIFNAIKIINNTYILLIPFLINSFINFLVLNNIFGYSTLFYQENRFVGLSTNSNLLAIYMFFSIFTSIYFLLKNKNLYLNIYLYFNILISIYIILFTGSKKGTISVFILLLSYLLIYMKIDKKIIIKSIKLIILISLLSIFINFYIPDNILIDKLNTLMHRFQNFSALFDNNMTTDRSTEYRLIYINKALDLFSENPLLGLGSDNFKVYMGEYSHSNYTEILANLGLIGFILYYSMYIVLIRDLIITKLNNINILLLVLLMILLFLDIAYVSYYSKTTLLLFILILTLKKGKYHQN